MQNTHIDVTVDCRQVGGSCIDLRIPKELKVALLIRNILTTLKLPFDENIGYFLKIPNKQIVLFSEDYLSESHVTTGDIIEICK